MPQINPRALTIGTYTSTSPSVEEMIRASQAFEAMGAFDHIWAGDQLQFQHPHRMWVPEICEAARDHPKLGAMFALPIAMSVIGQHTSRILIGQGVLDVLRRGPSILAQEFLTTQHMTGGRAIFVCASGEWKNIGPYGYDHANADGKMVEIIRLLRHFLDSQEPITYDGRWWKLEDAVVELPPLDGVPPPLWLAGGGPKILRAVGEYGDGWFVYTPGSVGGHPERIAEGLRSIHEHAERAGRDPAKIACATIPLLLCHPDREKVDAWLDHPFMRWHALTGFPRGADWRAFGFEHPLGDDFAITKQLNTAVFPLERALDLCRATPREMVKHAVYWGTAEDVAPRLIAEVEAGVRHFALCNYVGFLSRAEAPAATAELIKLAKLVRDRFPDLAGLPRTI